MNSPIINIMAEKDKDLRIVQCNQGFLDCAGMKSDDKVLGCTDDDLPWQEYADVYTFKSR
jgi:hypothetical protein